MVKFLITGLIGITLTACGGGGGGGSSSTPAPPIVKPEEPAPTPIETITKDYKNEGHDLTGGNFVVAGTVSGEKENLVGITATNANVESKATITLTGDNSIGILGTSSGTKSSYSVINNGELSISGNNSKAILVKNGVNGINKGKIKLISKEFKETIEKITHENSYGYGEYWSKSLRKYITHKQWDYLVGMSAEKDSKIINENEISLLGSGIAMFADTKSKAINNGKISATSQKQLADFSDLREDSSGNKSENNWTSEIYTPVFGMLISNESLGENGEKGLISITGEGFGIFAEKNSSATNNGTISGESLEMKITYPETNSEYLGWSELIGIGSVDSNITNNGEINLFNSGVGMEASGNSIAINNGKITITSPKVAHGTSIGMTLEEGATGVNSGLISIVGMND
ncbi:MAG: hypothetical protein ACRC5T_04280, partial [Cetobacterium sp.]